MNNKMTVAEAIASAIESFSSKRLGEAEATCRQILATQPQHPDALHILGLVAYQTKHYDAAVKLFNRAIANSGAAAQYYNSLGNTLRAMNRIAQARDAYRRAIELEPQLAAAHYGLGLLEYGVDDFPAAAQSFRTTTIVAPNWSEGHAHLGNALFQLRQVEEAVECYRRAVALNPNDATTHSNLGLSLQDLGLTDEGIDSCRRAIALQPDFAGAHNNLSLALLLTGDFDAGLAHHEWRWKVSNLRMGGRRYEQPAWRGEPLDGRTILLHAEQGAGDTLQFLRYAPMVAARGGRVLIEVPPELKRVAMSLKGVEQVIATGDPLPAFEQHCPLLSLPLAFGTTLATIPGDTPYLAAAENLQAEWSARLAADAHPRIGLIWAGRPEHRCDRERSLELAALTPLADTGATFYSLQKGPPADQAKSPPPGMVLHELGDAFTDFADTAAAMSALDLVISVDTSPAHLAGAIGKPVWLLLAHAPDWRWLLKREDSPWYPTARLFRQTTRNEWGPVIARVAAELRRFCAGDVTALTAQKGSG